MSASACDSVECTAIATLSSYLPITFLILMLQQLVENGHSFYVQIISSF